MLLCCGEALIDMIPKPTVSTGDGFVPYTGGAVFNTAVALGRLGVDVGQLTGLSTDMFGGLLRADMHASGVNTDYIIQSDRPTTLAFVKLVEGQATYSFFDENSAGRNIEVADLPPLSTKISALYFSGISLASEPCADTYLALAQRHAKEKLIVVDPNIRPSFIESQVRFRARLDKLFSIADIVKISDEDLNWIYPEDATLAEKALKIQELGPSIVVLTQGRDGAIGYIPDEVVSAPARLVDVVDTVGAGDTFNAGMLAKLSEFGMLSRNQVGSINGEKLRQALEFGAHVASITVSREGANPPWLHELAAKKVTE